ncbi:MAG: hypothetical protein HYU87_11585 [Chloroflexi bacterium]|nr:hypothetical protein [Chloroflexota bacterium]
MTNEIASELGALLAQAHILMFEYDRDGFLVSAVGSCIGGVEPDVEIRAGLVSPTVVRRAVAGERVMDRARVAGRWIAVVHEPVRGERGQVERVLATAFDIGDRALPQQISAWGEALAIAS